MTCPRHGTPERLRDGRLAAGHRDASFYNSPGHSWVIHAALRVPSGQLGPRVVPACDTIRAYLVDDLLEAAAEVPGASRCRRPACALRFLEADLAGSH